MTLRRALPSAVTFVTLSFGFFSIMASLEGRWWDAGWLVIYGVLTDKIDGFLARLLHAETEFGSHLDSFADILDFGIAPAVLFYCFLSRRPEFGARWPFLGLVAACLLWACAASARLARFNAIKGEAACASVYFGTPTTVTGAAFVALFLTLLKYQGAAIDRGPYLLSGMGTRAGVWGAFPAAGALGGALMVSNLRVAKFGFTRNRPLLALLMLAVAAAIACGVMRTTPEYILLLTGGWIAGSAAWNLCPAVRAIRPPALR